MKSTAPVVATLAILFALAAPMHARAAIGPAMGGYSAGAVFEGVEVPSYRWLRYGNEYVSWGAGYRERVHPSSAAGMRSHRGPRPRQ
jgi:hypothetical protein